jgi:CPA2 family monovalent cation:H+ antiporter-2
MHAEVDILPQLGLIFTVAVGMALLLTRVGLPSVLAYVGTGFVLGPPCLALVERDSTLEGLAELGVILLLFTIGLEFSLDEIRRSWRAVLLGGALQVGLTVACVAVVGLLFGASPAVALTWGFLVSLSSTAVVLRLLDVRGEMKAAHGRLVVGVLIFQDLCVVPMMLLLPVLGGGEAGSVVGVMLEGAVLVALILLISRVVVPPLLRQVARSRNREVFLLAVLAIAGLTAVATSFTGLSLALGAFLAGMVLAETQYAHQAMSDVLPLRAVMMCVFFVAIGMLIDLDAVFGAPLSVIGLFLGIMVGKFALVMVVALALRFPVRVAVLAAAALAQAGEFSLVLADEASGFGLITPEQQRLFLAASVLSIAVAPIAVMLSPRFLAGSPLLDPLERLLDGSSADPEPGGDKELHGHVIVAGLGVGGRTVVGALESAGLVPLIIELDPERVLAERARGRCAVFGDSSSHEVLHHAGILRARALVLAISDTAAAHHTVEVVRELRPDLPIVLRTRFLAEEGQERAPGVEVLSEEYAGAMTLAGLTLKSCGVADWTDVVAKLVGEHRSPPADAEDTLGPPPPPGQA